MPLFWFGFIKRILFPVKGLEGLCPKTGVIVDLGCGNGFFAHYLATKGLERKVVGYDWDAKRLAAIQRAPIPNNLAFAVAPIFEAIPQQKFVNHFLISDVLYLLPRDLQERVLRACYDHLPVGGSLILKISDTTPRWKYFFERLQETLAVKIFHVSKSGERQFYHRSSDAYQMLLLSLGFSVSLRRLDRWRPYPHVALVCVK